MIASFALILLSAAASTTTCESLASLKLDKTFITGAEMVPEGPAPARGGGQGRAAADGARGAPQAAPILPAHCRVQLVLKPTSDSVINM